MNRTPRRRYYWLAPPEREARNEHIMELWAMGLDRREIATLVALSPQRVGQIVNGYGESFGGGEAEANSS